MDSAVCIEDLQIVHLNETGILWNDFDWIAVNIDTVNPMRIGVSDDDVYASPLSSEVLACDAHGVNQRLRRVP